MHESAPQTARQRPQRGNVCVCVCVREGVASSGSLLMMKIYQADDAKIDKSSKGRNKRKSGLSLPPVYSKV